MNNSFEILNVIAQSIFDKKGFNILALDVRPICTMTEYFVIAEGTVDRHVRAIGMFIIEKLKEKGIVPLHVEGEQIGDWLVIDYGYIVIHLFMPELRGKYSLEELWHDGKIIDVKIEMSSLKGEDYE